MLKIKICTADKSKQVLSYMSSFLQSRFVKTSSEDATPSNPEVNHTEDLLVRDKEMGRIKKVPSKRMSRPPFVKNLFCGNFDAEILNYVEIMEKSRSNLIEEVIIPIKDFFERVENEKGDGETRKPPDTSQVLKELNLCGIKIPEEYGGLGFRNMEYARIAEALTFHGSITMNLLDHQTFAIMGLLNMGTDAQKQKYLPKLASGEWTAALCFLESHQFDISSIQTLATKMEDDKGFYLSGTKSFVIHKEIPDLMTVISLVKHPNKPTTENSLTLLLVEKQFGGIRTGTKKWQMCGLDTMEVHFDKTFVPIDNLLGKDGEGINLFSDILSSRYSLGCLLSGVLKGLLKTTVKHSVTCKQFGNTLSEFAFVKEKLARAVIDIYALESMSYLTSGLMDSHENQDCLLESAIIKIFSLEKTLMHISSLLQMMSGTTFLKGEVYEGILAIIGISLLYDGTNDMTRISIGLEGLQHAIKQRKKDLASRSFLSVPFMLLKSTSDVLLKRRKNPKLDWQLHESLHPSLKESANDLELCVKRFGIASKHLLSQDKDLVLPSKQWNIKRMADIAIDLYAMTAVLGRASRAYCIGVHNADQEVRIAKYFVSEATERIHQRLKKVTSEDSSGEHLLGVIADALIKESDYHVKHPLNRTLN